MARLSEALVRPDCLDRTLIAKLGQPLQREVHAFDLLKRPEVAYDDLCTVAPEIEPGWRTDERLSAQVKLQVEVQAKYSGYLKRQMQEIERQQRHEETLLPADLDYSAVSGLSNEARQALSAVRPQTLGQAARIPGLTPAAVSLLMVHLKKRAAPPERARVAFCPATL